MNLTENRIENNIAKFAENLKGKLDRGELTSAQVQATHAKLDVDMAEYCTFQEVKSLAHASNKITFEEATTIFAYLGNSPEDFNAQPIAVKVVLTKLFAELLDWKIKSRRAA